MTSDETSTIRPKQARLHCLALVGSLPFLAFIAVAMIISDLSETEKIVFSLFSLAVSIPFSVFMSFFLHSTLTFSLTEEGISQKWTPMMFKGFEIPEKKLAWDELKRVSRHFFPIPIYQCSKHFFSGQWVLIPAPWLMEDPDRFFELLDRYAPEDNPLRVRLGKRT